VAEPTDVQHLLKQLMAGASPEENQALLEALLSGQVSSIFEKLQVDLQLLEDARHLTAQQRLKQRLVLLGTGPSHQLLQQMLDVGRFGHGTQSITCLLYTSPSPRDRTRSRMPSSA